MNSNEDKKKRQARQVKSFMVLKGWTFATMAKRLKISRKWLSANVNGHANSHKVKQGVAKLLKVSHEDLWGHKRAG